MIDPRLLRSNPELVRSICRMRKSPVDVDRLLRVDEAWRQATVELGELQHAQKGLSGPEQRERAREAKQQIAEAAAREKTLKNERDALLAWVPNLLAPDTPEGESDADNVELATWGKPPTFTFSPESHETIGKRLGILDLQRGAEVAGSGFYYWMGDGARLAWALFTLALDLLVARGYTPMFTPVVAREHTLYGTGYLPFFADEIYRLTDNDLCLIGTAEQTLVGLHADETLPAASLPRRYCAFSPCFRTEAGAYGKASRGAFRVHQFHKVEQIIFCRPEESEEWHETCLRNETEMMERLELPHRVVRVCRGDLGAPGYKKYDVEGWFAGYGGYRETHSNTNLLDYQTRRLNIRARDGKETAYPHTISATMITDRALLAILENNQQPDGSVIIPQALRGYLGGQVRVVPTS
ncbi:MAG: serine--tRNA ligase [Armatimonadota bacterium]